MTTWKIAPYNKGYRLHDKDTGYHVADITYVGHENVHLIKAAPSMREALESVMQSGRVGCNCHNTCEGTCTFALVKKALDDALP